MDAKLVTEARKEFPCRKCGGTGTKYDERYLTERVCAECCGTGINWRKALTEAAIKRDSLIDALKGLYRIVESHCGGANCGQIKFDKELCKHCIWYPEITEAMEFLN